MKKITVFQRSLFALSLGCALAALPLSVRAQEQDAPAAPTSPDPVPGAETAPTPGPDSAPPTSAVDSATSTVTEAPKKVAAADDKLSAAEKVTARKFANGNEGEVEMGKLALANSENQAVKDFAQKMIDDHGKANEELLEIATAHGLELKPELTPTEKTMYNKAKGLKGASFDAAYMKHAVADHTEDVREYKKALPTIKDPHLQAYTEKTLPIIEGHLTMAKEMKGMDAAGDAKPAKATKKGKKG